MYGYTTDHYAQYDVVELSSQAIYDVAEAIRKKYKRPRTTVPKLEDLECVEEGYAISRPPIAAELHDAIPVDLQLLLSALAIDAESAKSAQNVFKLGERNFSFASADLLAATIRKRLAEYKTTISEDDDLLLRLDKASGVELPTGVHPTRYQMAVQVRKGEKEILEQILQLAQQLITNNTNGKRKRSVDDERAKKTYKSK
jgi:hypothetical protein